MPRAANAPVVVEVAVDSVAGARTAAAAGADRLELCSSLAEGGLTPSAGLLAAVQAAVRVPVCTMVRPRAGDFRYDDGEFDVMLRDVVHLRAAGAAGIVAGVLRADGHVDAERLRELVAAARPLPVTFHRAFDLVADPAAALEALIAAGVARVLTSGQAATAIDGAEAIARHVAAAGTRLRVIAGAGVRPDNVRDLVQRTGVQDVHLSATVWRPGAMLFRRPGVPIATTRAPDEFAVRGTDGNAVAKVVAALAAPRDRASMAAMSEPIDTLLRDVGTVLAATGDGRWLELLDRVRRHFDCPVGTVHLLDAADGHLHLAAQRGLPPPVLDKVAVIPIGKGMAGIAAERRQPVQVCNLQTDATGVVRPGAKLTQMEGSLAVPMLDGEQLRGVLGIAKPVAYDFTPAETQLLLEVAALAAAAVR
ncbi:MAG: GAF domain-containing protein [Planctomycetes bacterium]|nr:GAF domain-containing protein [Planctomycetota bacterium]